MTCIVGIRDASGVYLGADTLGSNGHNKSTYKTAKLVELVNKKQGTRMLLGYTTSYRFGQLLAHSMKLPKHPAGMDTLDYLVNRFIPKMQTVFKLAGYTPSDGEGIVGGSALIAYAGRLFILQPNFSILEPEDPYASVGSGSEAARAVLGTLKELVSSKVVSESLESQLRLAIMIVSEQIVSVGKEAIVRKL